MKRFTELVHQLERAASRAAALGALEGFRKVASPEDGALVDKLLAGERLAAGVPTRRLRVWATDLSGYPPWMVEACYRQVGDLADTLALLLPGGPGSDLSLHEVVSLYLEPLQYWDEPIQLGLIRDYWLSLNREQARVFGKLVNGTLRLRLPAAGSQSE